MTKGMVKIQSPIHILMNGKRVNQK